MILGDMSIISTSCIMKNTVIEEKSQKMMKSKGKLRVLIGMAVLAVLLTGCTVQNGLLGEGGLLDHIMLMEYSNPIFDTLLSPQKAIILTLDNEGTENDDSIVDEGRENSKKTVTATVFYVNKEDFLSVPEPDYWIFRNSIYYIYGLRHKSSWCSVLFEDGTGVTWENCDKDHGVWGRTDGVGRILEAYGDVSVRDGRIYLDEY